MPQAVLDRFECRERSRIVAARPLQHLLARHPEHDPPAQGIAIEQNPHESAWAPSLGAPAVRQTPRCGKGDVGKD